MLASQDELTSNLEKTKLVQSFSRVYTSVPDWVSCETAWDEQKSLRTSCISAKMLCERDDRFSSRSQGRNIIYNNIGSCKT